MGYYFLYGDNNKSTIGYVNNNKLMDIEEDIVKSSRDDIFIGRIIKPLDSIKGYIIEIEKGTKACIEKKQIVGKVKLGDEIIVQLYKKTDNNKLDKYTMNYSIAGDNMVYYPLREKNFYSKKLDISKISYLKGIVSDEMNLKGITFRTSSGNMKNEEILKDYNSLKKIDDYIIKNSKFLPIPRRLYSSSKRVLEFIKEDFKYIITNNKEDYGILREYFSKEEIILDENYNYKYDVNITEDLISINSREIKLYGNSSIVIEKTEALTVIDVNSGSEEDFLEVNKNAVKETVRQIGLRKIQGIVLIDIINLKKSDMDLLEEYVKILLKDYIEIKYYGISNTGLLEFIKTGINIDI